MCKIYTLYYRDAVDLFGLLKSVEGKLNKLEGKMATGQIEEARRLLDQFKVQQ